MKKTDIAMIILIATIGVLVSFFVVRGVLGDTSSEPQSVQKVDAITPEMPEVSENIFNAKAINPSVEVEIKGSVTDANEIEAAEESIEIE